MTLENFNIYKWLCPLLREKYGGYSTAWIKLNGCITSQNPLQWPHGIVKCLRFLTLGFLKTRRKVLQRPLSACKRTMEKQRRNVDL